MVGEVVGLLRELAMGPRRYRDLATRLPGIVTNLLASRLRSLVDGGVIERVRADRELLARARVIVGG